VTGPVLITEHRPQSTIPVMQLPGWVPIPARWALASCVPSLASFAVQDRTGRRLGKGGSRLAARSALGRGVRITATVLGGMV